MFPGSLCQTARRSPSPREDKCTFAPNRASCGACRFTERDGHAEVSVRPATYLGGVAEGKGAVSMVLIETSQ